MYIKKYIWQTQTLGSRKYKGCEVKRISLHIFCVYLMRFYFCFSAYRLEDIFLSFMESECEFGKWVFFCAVIKIFIAFILHPLSSSTTSSSSSSLSLKEKQTHFRMENNSSRYSSDCFMLQSVHSRIICIGVTPSSWCVRIERKHLGTIQCGARFGEW